jgi:tetratricopeptide (TPR) repeat protein
MSRSLSLLSLLLLLVVNFASAQDQGDFNAHALHGTVVNVDASPIADAMVEVRNLQSGTVVARVYTSASGEFLVPLVQPGQYVISVTEGTRTAQQQIAFGGFEPDVKVTIPGQSSDPKSKDATVSVASLSVPGKAKRELESARKAISRNKLDEAASELQRALTIAPQYPEALSLRAVVRLATGDTKSATEDAKRSVEIDPSNSLAYTILGASYNATGQFLLAVASLQKALKIDPTFWQGHYEMAKSLYAQGKSASALLEVDTAGRNAPKEFAPIHLVRGAILMQLHRTSEAAEELQQFLKQDPKNPDAANVERTLATISQPSTNSPVGPMP